MKELRYDPEACNRGVPPLARCLACEAEGSPRVTNRPAAAHARQDKESSHKAASL